MKKLLTILVAGLLAICTCFSLVGCGSNGNKLIFGKELLKCDSQLDTLVKLDSGSADIAIIDSVMAGYYTSTGAYADKVVKLPYVFAEEQYGIAGRKNDKAFLSKINTALIALFDNGTMEEVAYNFGLQSEIAVTAETVDPYATATDSSWTNIVNSGKIIIGYTVFAPIAYSEASTGLTGFDIELARSVVAYLNTEYNTSLELEFQLIDWDSKETLLNGGTIDLIWNGLTITEERAENMCISVPYLFNKQVALVRTADAEKYSAYDSDFASVIKNIADSIIAVESGSAGEEVVVIA